MLYSARMMASQAIALAAYCGLRPMRYDSEVDQEVLEKDGRIVGTLIFFRSNDLCRLTVEGEALFAKFAEPLKETANDHLQDAWTKLTIRGMRGPASLVKFLRRMVEELAEATWEPEKMKGLTEVVGHGMAHNQSPHDIAKRVVSFLAK